MSTFGQLHRRWTEVSLRDGSQVVPGAQPSTKIRSLYDWLREPSSFPKSFGRERLELTSDAIYVVGATEVVKFPRSELVTPAKVSIRKRWQQAVFELEAHQHLAPGLYVGVLPFESVQGVPVWNADEPLSIDDVRQMPRNTTGFCFVLKRLFRARSIGEEQRLRGEIELGTVSKVARRLARAHIERAVVTKQPETVSKGEIDRFVRRHTFRAEDIRAAYRDISFFDGFILAEAFGLYHRELRALAPELSMRERIYSAPRVVVRAEKTLLGQVSGGLPEVFILPELVIPSEKARKELSFDPLCEAVSFLNLFEQFSGARSNEFIKIYQKQIEGTNSRLLRFFRLFYSLREIANMPPRTRATAPIVGSASSSAANSSETSSVTQSNRIKTVRSALMRTIFQPEAPTVVFLGGDSAFRDQYLGVWLAKLFKMKTVPGIVELLASEAQLKHYPQELRERALSQRMIEIAERHLSAGESVIFEDAPLELLAEVRKLEESFNVKTHASYLDSYQQKEEGQGERLLREVLSIKAPSLRGKNVEGVTILECSENREENLAAILSSLRSVS